MRVVEFGISVVLRWNQYQLAHSLHMHISRSTTCAYSCAYSGTYHLMLQFPASILRTGSCIEFSSGTGSSHDWIYRTTESAYFLGNRQIMHAHMQQSFINSNNDNSVNESQRFVFKIMGVSDA